MSRKLSISIIALSLAVTASAQTTGRLSRVIPELYGPEGLIVDSLAPLPSGDTHSAHFNSDFQTEFNQFNIAFATQVASVPIPSPAAGFTYEFDPETGVFVRSTGSFGPIFTQRAETIGKNKFSFGFAYQRFTFDTIEGISLEDVPAVFTHDGARPGGRADVVTTRNRIDSTVDQFVTFVTAGLTDNIDLTVAVPIVKAKLDITSTAMVQRIGTTNPEVHFFFEGIELGDTRTFFNGASASGIGDIRVQAKRLFWSDQGAAFSAGIDLRFPSGDEEDLLGTGAMGIRPFAALSSSHGILSAHLNAAYQWNGKSVLAGDIEAREKGELPDQFQYSAAVDFAVGPRVTLVVDLLGQVVIDTPRLLRETFQALDGSTTFDNIAFDRSTVSQLNIATGIKINVADSLLIDANALIALDDAGLRDSVTPLVGVEYTF